MIECLTMKLSWCDLMDNFHGLISVETDVGFQWDRYWLVVNYKGRAYTQRVEPKLALVESELPKEALLEDWEPTKDSFLGKFLAKL